MFRSDGRPNDQPRNVTITPSFLVFPEGSALIEVGETKVVCTATLEERVPPFLRGQGKGWITAEYNMLPRSTLTRTPRERETGRVSGRTLEIQRLIGRSLRAVGDMTALGERTLVDRLRRPASRRRHSHGLHHRRIQSFLLPGHACTMVNADDIIRRSMTPAIGQAVAAISVEATGGQREYIVWTSATTRTASGRALGIVNVVMTDTW